MRFAFYNGGFSRSSLKEFMDGGYHFSLYFYERMNFESRKKLLVFVFKIVSDTFGLMVKFVCVWYGEEFLKFLICFTASIHIK